MERSYIHQQGLGIFRLSGERDLADAKATWLLFAERIVADQLQGVLVFDDAKSTLSAGQVYFFAEWLMTKNFPDTVKIAIVVSDLEHANENPLGTNCVFNRGWRYIRCFISEQAARAWLTEPTDSRK